MYSVRSVVWHFYVFTISLYVLTIINDSLLFARPKGERECGKKRPQKIAEIFAH